MLAATSAVRGPLVHGKELEHVKLLKSRKFHGRLDIGPFYGIYALIAILAYRCFAFEQWSNLKYTSYACAAAAVLHIFTFLFTQWSVRIKALVGYRTVKDVDQAQMVLAIPGKFSGTKELVPLAKKRVASEGTQYSFEFRKHKFIYNNQDHAFQKQEFPVQEPFSYYNAATGYGTEARVAAAVDTWGLNEFEVPLPPFISLLKEQMLAPFFVFQVFCVALWCIDEYWYYSLFTLFMLITFECTVVSQRLRNLTELRTLQTPRQALPVYRNGRWDTLPGENLLPGDIISIGRPLAGPGSDEMVVPADCLILAGSCIVEEAVLTGESTPQWKVPILGVSDTERLDIARHKQYLLFGGTKILQHTGDKTARLKTPDGGCLAVVLRTGFETSQGQLMRTILYSTERVTANNLETGLFILFLLCFAVTASYYVLINGLADPTRSRFKLALNCIMIITSVIPPELPMELSIAVNTSLVALARKAVFCTEPFRIPFAGKVEVCCFDKTGTLTSDHLLLDGVAAADGRCEGEGCGEVLRDMKELPQDTARVMAGCHSLVLLGEEVIGDPLEKAALEAVRWSYSSDVSISPDKKVRASIIARHHFSSDLKRMSSIVRVEDDNLSTGEIQYAVLLKGAPEVVANILDTVPAGYDAMYRKLAAQGGRVISLAYSALPVDVDSSYLRTASREEIEGRGGFRFVGFAVFQCPLKEESEPALQQLEESSHQLMMITGDSPLTACYAASQVHIVTREVLLLDHINPDNASAPLPPPKASSGASPSSDTSTPALDDDSSYRWSSPDTTTTLPFSRSWPDILQLAASYDLCISGDSLTYLEAIGLAARVIPLAQVYARVSPEQKELVVKTLRAAGHTVLMCGDGTNDVGGLKAAHIGVALLNVVKDDKKKKAKDGKKKAPKKKSAGQKQLDEWRKQGREVTPQMEKLASWLDKMENAAGDADAPMLKPGDASMASAFTAKSTGVTPVLDIIKQGRCTLVTTVQMFKILGLLCLSTAYSLSVMYLQGVKLSDVQATLSGFLTAGMFFFISNTKPLERLSTTRPHPNIFSIYFFASLIGQFALHMVFLVFMYHRALEEMPEDQRQDSDSDFKPNLVNTVCYLVQAVVQLSTFAANYVGHPFNTSLADNKPMFASLKYSFVFLAVVGLDLVPNLASSFSLVPIPPSMKAQLLLGALITYFGCFYWERMLRNALPPTTPPPKGYMWHQRELAQAKQLTVQKKKDQ